MKRKSRSTKSSPGAETRPAPRATAPARRSRREFIRLLAAGSAAVLAAPAPESAAAPAPRRGAAVDSTRMRRARTGEGGASGSHPMIPAELEKQKKYAADSLKVIRDYALPPGTPPAYLFRPLAAKRRKP